MGTAKRIRALPGAAAPTCRAAESLVDQFRPDAAMAAALKAQTEAAVAKIGDKKESQSALEELAQLCR